MAHEAVDPAFGEVLSTSFAVEWSVRSASPFAFAESRMLQRDLKLHTGQSSPETLSVEIIVAGFLIRPMLARCTHQVCEYLLLVSEHLAPRVKYSLESGQHAAVQGCGGNNSIPNERIWLAAHRQDPQKKRSMASPAE